MKRRQLLTLQWRPVDLLVLAAYSPLLALVMPRTTTLPAWWLAAGLSGVSFLLLAGLLRARKPSPAEPRAPRPARRRLLVRTSLWTGRILGLVAVILTVRGSATAAADLLTGAHLHRWSGYPLTMTLGIWFLYLGMALILAVAACLCLTVPALSLRPAGVRLPAARRALIVHFN